MHTSTWIRDQVEKGGKEHSVPQKKSGDHKLGLIESLLTYSVGPGSFSYDAADKMDSH